MPEICFLTYINRSGSTLLADKLDMFSDICVSIEADLRDVLVIRNGAELDSYLEEAYRSNKFSEWGIGRRELRERLDGCGFPVTFKEVLETILRLYCEDGRAKVHIFKDNDSFRHHATLRQMFPSAKFIFVGRDPRGIFNSMKRSIDSTGRPMRQKLASFASDYAKTAHFIDACLRGKDYFYFVKYEDLILDEERVMTGLVHFLGVSEGTGDRTSGYFKKIPGNQKHLHRNLEDGTMKEERIRAWKNELEPKEIFFLQKSLERLLVAKGYPLVEVPGLSFSDRLGGLGRLLYYQVRFGLPMLVRRCLR